MNKPKRIFTFWEPKDKIPPYLQLCMETWKKFLPDHEIVILDYDSLDEWLGKEHYLYDLYVSYSLPKQADAIRAALLDKYGGLWMDCDTIITSDNINNLLEKDSETVFIGSHIGFINSIKSASIIKKWHKKIKRNIAISFVYRYFPFLKKIIKFFVPKTARYIDENHWSYLGNFILDPLFKKSKRKQVYSLDREKLKLLPEVIWLDENGITDSIPNNYRRFYFKENLADYALKDNAGVIYLHNSWTPAEIKNMSKEEFLQLDCTLSNILKRVL